jgi:hypothetical protein
MLAWSLVDLVLMLASAGVAIRYFVQGSPGAGWVWALVALVWGGRSVWGWSKVRKETRAARERGAEMFPT